MCGIAGVFAHPSAESIAARMSDQLVHRGPDDQGTLAVCTGSGAPAGALALRRLAIQDLSPSGHQPMVSEDGRHAIVFNGEIYNVRELRTELESAGVRLRGHSDTEVILEGLVRRGRSFVARLRGMFAFVFWDQDRGTALFARDMFGIKPLYYVKSGETLAFASEVRSLLASGMAQPRLSYEAVSSYLAYGSVSEPLSIIDGVLAFPPGCVAELRMTNSGAVLGEPELFSEHPLCAGGDEVVAGQGALELVRSRLLDSVAHHLVSDVPVALFLSGGIDSAAIAALASEVSADRLDSFTVSFSEREFSESAIASNVARRFGLRHHEIPLSAANLAEMLPTAFAAMDQPSMDGLNTYVISRAVAASGIKVVLSGLGGDELFGGYPSFARAGHALRFRTSSFPLAGMLGGASRMLGGVRGEKLRLMLADADPSTGAYRASRTLFFDRQIESLLGSVVVPNLDAPPCAMSLITKVSWYELKGYMLNTLLRDSDVFSMANSLELRVPFLDPDVARAVASIDDSAKRESGRVKPLLVEALGDVLPREVWDRPKQGFALPFKNWLGTALYEEVDAKFQSDALERVGIDSRYASRVWKRYAAHRGVTWSRPWALYTLVRWAEENGAGMGEPSATGHYGLPATVRGRGARRSAPRIHVWAPDMFEFKGGIQVYQLDLVRALHTVLPRARLSVFLKNDRGSVKPPRDLHGVRFSFAGASESRFRTPKFLRQIVGAAMRERPELIIVGHLNFAAAAYALRRTAGVPYWIVAYGIEAWDVKNPLARRALRHAELVVAISEHTRRRLLAEHELDPERVVLLPPTFAEREFFPEEKPASLLQRYGLTSDQPVIMTVARLVDAERYKGYDQLIEAVGRVRERFPSVRYVLIGRGDDTARVRRMVHDRGLSEHVILAGFIPDSEMRDHYNLCDVFAMPSKREGFGIVYVEAAACGKRVLGGSRDGAVDALNGGEFGALVDPDDVDQIAGTLVSLLSGDHSSSLMSKPQELRAAVIDKFGVSAFRSRLEGHLRSVNRGFAAPVART
jgi:asparagine synthase (glutamine-hydrolysing)